MSDVLRVLKLIMIQRDISENQLANLSDVPQSTINSFFRKNNTPSISTLQQLCKGLDITLSQFFNTLEQEKQLDITEKDAYYDLNIDEYQHLSHSQKSIINSIIKEFTKKSSK
jgi:transcriptional regulator with XRE-family HTH domain